MKSLSLIFLASMLVVTAMPGDPEVKPPADSYGNTDVKGDSQEKKPSYATNVKPDNYGKDEKPATVKADNYGKKPKKKAKTAVKGDCEAKRKQCLDKQKKCMKDIVNLDKDEAKKRDDLKKKD